ncbi:AAA family ATPase [Candidatus Bathyarchaeota archaeon]|nr:AAA family ATPase [Candidatus Bathyarchaeota archaeon]MBS7631549.1 AAA family ATPase [Candidatus Bathyarchaeota archaeon]
MKFAVSGKGGVGKTFVSATLARLFARESYNVIAVDADPNINLSISLGISREVSDKIIPISDNAELIKERTGSEPGKSSVIFKMTPKVDDIVERFGVTGPDGVKLLVMGTVKAGDSGCMCPANALLRVLIQHLLIQRRDLIIMDMEAGLEHLGRGTARRFDSMLVVLDPTIKSVDTLKRVVSLAKQIDIPEVLAVGNKIEDEKGRALIRDEAETLGIPVACYIPHDPAISSADLLGKAPLEYDEHSPAINALKSLKDFLRQRYGF